MGHVLDWQGLAEPQPGFGASVAGMGSVVSVLDSTFTTIHVQDEDSSEILG